MDSRYTHNNNTDLNGSAYSLPLPSPSSSECSNSFSFESNNVVSSTYYQHSQSSEVETTGASKPKPKKTYTCSYCKKVFTRPSALQTHTYTHTAEKPFQCSSPNCGRYFSVVSNLRRHLKVHQQTQSSNKLSSEDRLRCVKRLMLRSKNLLKHKNDHYHPILPVITSSATATQGQFHNASAPYMYLPSPPLKFAPIFEDPLLTGVTNNSNLILRDSFFDIPQPWPTHQDDPYYSYINDRQLYNSYESNFDSNKYRPTYLDSSGFLQSDTTYVPEDDENKYLLQL